MNFLSCVLALSVVACGGGTSSTDGGAVADAGRTDGGAPADGGEPEQPVLTAWTLGEDGAGDETEVPVDLSCLGTRAAPMPGEATDFPVRVVTRGVTDTAAPAGVTYRIYTDNVLPADHSCAAGNCVEGTTGVGGAGTTTSIAAGRWIATEVVANAAGMIQNSFYLNMAAELTPPEATPGGPTPALEISAIGSIFNIALGQSQTTPQEGAVFFTGTAVDCAGHPLEGVEIRVFESSERIEGGVNPTGVRYVYWPNQSVSAPFPSATLKYTSNVGRYAGGNLTAGKALRVELWAVRTAGAGPSRIGCEEIPGVADSITVVDIGPTRADGPAACAPAP